MRFSELIGATIDLLQSSGRMTYRALQREFDLDAETLDDLRVELIEARRVASAGKQTSQVHRIASNPLRH